MLCIGIIVHLTMILNMVTKTNITHPFGINHSSTTLISSINISHNIKRYLRTI